MSQQRLTDRAEVDAVTKDDLIHVVQDGVSFKATVEKVKESFSDDFATSEQGDKADSAVQPDVLETAINEIELTPGPQGEEGEGVPTGGATGQVLAKVSATNFDTEWVDQTGGGSFTVATAEELNTGTNNTKGATPLGLQNSRYRQVHYGDTDTTVANGDLLIDDTVEELVGGEGEGGQTEEFDNGNSGTTKTIDWNNGRHQKLTLTGDVTLTFTNPDFVGWYNLRIIQDATGGRDITLSSGVISPNILPSFDTMVGGEEAVLAFRFNGSGYIVASTEIYVP